MTVQADAPPATALGAGAWGAAPPVPPRPPVEMGRWSAEALALVVGIAGPLARAVASPRADATEVAVVGLAAQVLLLVLPRRWGPVRALVALGAGAALYPLEGEVMAVWLAVGLLAADWGVRRVPPIPGRAVAPTAALPVSVLLLVAAWRGQGHSEGVAFLGMLALLVGGALLVSLLAVLHVQGLDRLARRFGRAVGHVVGTVAFTLLGVAVVVVPWAIHRLVRIDPLDAPDGASTGWLVRERRTAHPERLWSPDPVRGRRSVGRRVRDAVPGLALGAVAIALVAAAAGFGILRDDGVSETSTDVAIVPPPQYEGADEWYQDYWYDISWATLGEDAFQPLEQQRVADIESAHVNVRDGVRRTWSDPDLGPDPVVIWVYGGSTTFGVGQRDDHTIPSELARAAAEDGVDVEVVNRGVVGDLHWREANRLSWDLTVTDTPPDLVVFYDGVNEIWGALDLATGFRGPSDAPVDPTYRRVWGEYVEDRDAVAGRPDDARVVEHPQIDASPESVGRLAVDLYDRSREMSRRLGEAYDIPVRWYWQPSKFSRPTDPAEPADENPAWEAENARTYAAAEGNVPAGVVDLTDVLDGVEGPLFIDDVHHNEVAAEVVGRALWDDMAADVRAAR